MPHDPQPIIPSWSVQTHASAAAKAAYWAASMATALCAERPNQRDYCATQLLSAAKQMLAEAKAISAKVKAGEGSAMSEGRLT